MAQPDSRESSRRGGRLVFREPFAASHATAPAWKVAEISAELTCSIACRPCSARLLERGQSGMAASGGPECLDPSAILSFG